MSRNQSQMEQQRIVVAVGSIPKSAGTFTFYRNLRSQLKFRSIDVRCVAVGAGDAALWDESLADTGCVLLAPRSWDIEEQSRAFVEWCEHNGVNIVIGINSIPIISAVPHLPAGTRIVSRVANIFDSGYRNMTHCLERVSRLVATAPRHQEDLVQRYGVKAQRTTLISNGIDALRFASAAATRRGRGRVLQLGFVGRLEDVAKGVLFLPPILDHLREMGAEFELQIAGHGVYERGLKRRLHRYIRAGQVKFMGQIMPERMPNFLGGIDVLLFPSRSEGCPNTLLEAMMAGCVPVTWRLEGITDHIVDDGRTGFVCEMGECRRFAERVAELGVDRKRLHDMSQASAEDARKRFDHVRMSQMYEDLFRQILAEPDHEPPRDWSEFSPVDTATTSRSRSRLLAVAKKKFRRLQYHLHLADRYE